MAETVTGNTMLAQIGNDASEPVPSARDLPTMAVARRAKAVFMVARILNVVAVVLFGFKEL